MVEKKRGERDEERRKKEVKEDEEEKEESALTLTPRKDSFAIEETATPVTSKPIATANPPLPPAGPYIFADHHPDCHPTCASPLLHPRKPCPALLKEKKRLA